MTGYRYNAEKRTDRMFNTCGREKNPGAVKFYATNIAYAERYKDVYNEDGELLYTCSLEVTEINDVTLFDMAANFSQLSTYKMFVTAHIAKITADYEKFIAQAKKASERKMWATKIKELANEEKNIVANLLRCEFQLLSDFELQNELVSELKAKGYDGYFTTNEIAIF